MNFRKIRTSTREKPTCTELFDKMRSLKGKDDPKNKKELEKVKAEIAEASKRNLEIIKEEISKMKPNKGGMDHNKIWKLKKRLCPNSRDPPSAMLDSKGNLLTSNKAIEERALEVFSERLEGNTMKDHLKDL